MFATVWALGLPKPIVVAALAQALASVAPARRPASAVVAPRDSVRLLRRARSAQSEFELLHRSNLPIGDGMASGGSACDVRVGRFCYWSDDGDTSAPPAENARVVRARDRLIAVLDTVAATLPGDDWVAGQRVRYRVDAGRASDAVAVARTCRATAWWCGALLGFAMHENGEYAAADSSYAAALAAMPESDRCQWTDLSLLLEDELADRYRKLGCAARDSLAERLWWLSAPLYLVGTHDLRTEALARVTRARIEERARSPQIAWGDDVRELMLRYGWPTWYSRQPPPPGSMQEPAVTGHDPSPSFDFLPHPTAVDSPRTIDGSSWDLKARTARVRYAPAYLRGLEPLPHQIAVFRRGDSALVVGAFDLRDDTILAGRPIDAGLFVWTDERRGARSTRHDSSAADVLAVTAAWPPAVIGLEALSRDAHRAARARIGVREPAASGGVSLSDLLLYAPRGDAPVRLADALPLTLGSTRVHGKDPLGVYWETYGLPAQGTTMSVSLTVQRLDRGWLHRAAETLHLADRDAPLAVTWQEVPSRDSGIASRAVAVDISRLSPGTYRVQLTATPRGAAPVVSARDIQVAR